jgi:hypothetical protein
MEAEVDQASRVMHAVVEVPRPYDASSERPPLLPGSFVDVSISGRTLRAVVALPRDAMRDRDTVWIYNDGRLRIREVEVLRADREQSLIGSGLANGELVILSPLDAVTDGMKVRVANGLQEFEPPAAAEEVGAPDTAAALRTPPGSLPGGRPPDPRAAGRDQRIAGGAA